MRTKPINALVSRHTSNTAYKVDKWKMMHPDVRVEE